MKFRYYFGRKVKNYIANGCSFTKFGDSNIQYHDFNNGNTLTFKDKYTALLQQEL